jgi:anhydro-N-acetylmuramic acid kinase
VIPLIETFAISDSDKLATYTQHIALQIAEQLSDGMKVLATGGGALNTYLLSLIQQYSTATITLPSLQTVQYKEALIMAFLGLLRLLEQENVLSSVTGARKNTVNGAVYLP